MTRDTLACGFLLFLVTGLCSPIAAQERQLLVGTAKLELTPPVKTPLAGYSRRRGRLATGVHDPPFVRAVVLRSRSTTVALASCDLLIIDEHLFEAVAERVNAAFSQEPFVLLITATHTHSGPGAYGKTFLEKLSMGHFDPRVFEFLAKQIAQAILDASAQMQPATTRYATASTTGLVANRMRPEGVVDPDVAVCALYDQHERPVAVIVQFGAHPTTLGSWNRELSADYPGVLTRALEERDPSVMCLFVAGAVGDQAPVKTGEGFEPSQRIGKALAALVGTLLEERPPDEGPEMDIIKSQQRTVPLPQGRIRAGSFRLPGWISRLLVDDDATLTVIRVGNVLMMGLPCDVSAELGLELKRSAREAGYRPLLVGFANDYIGYCLPEHLYWTDTYEASMAFNGPTTGPMLVETLKQMIDAVR